MKHKMETRIFEGSLLIGLSIEKLNSIFNIKIDKPSDCTKILSEGDYITFVADGPTIMKVLQSCIPKKEDVIADKIQKEWEEFAKKEYPGKYCGKDIPLELYAISGASWDATEDVKLTKQGNEFILTFKKTNARFTLVPKKSGDKNES